ncbi:MAG: hypothetical protein IT572_05815 [Deltaproteobacteria bacterium]|nr:hypothetical protein [Deltaproteobacteria bacterium]
MSSIATLKNALKGAARSKNPAERGVRIAAILAEALRGIGQEPVLVGGAAVEFYTQGGYSTSDIDMVAPGGEALASLMRELGFKKAGKDYVDEQNKIYVEFPGESLGPSERYVDLQIDGRTLKVLSAEDLIVDRLCAFKFWQSAVDGVNALLLEELTEYDAARLRERAREEEVEDALDLLHQVRETAIRRKLSRSESSSLLETGMRGLKR